MMVQDGYIKYKSCYDSIQEEDEEGTMGKQSSISKC